ncbi:Mitochondrial import receptor subunit TOM70 [Cichlidogyrus casuarinus]|uniref:Mitochondrial import receptor subunit TOM70 n=1 Tax=Cichlidogyrus casuarinus TaxID=1844966 RepID=A0ABD2QLZ9_9PLAT
MDAERANSKLEEMKKLISKFPRCVESRTVYAQMLAEQSLFSEADDQFLEVLRLSPGSGMFYAQRAMLVLRWKQDREMAVEILKEGIKIDSQCGTIHELLSQLALELGDFDSAIVHLERAIQLSNNLIERKHLFGLHMGATAQREVCLIYGISREEIKAWHEACQAKMLMAMQGVR